MKNKKLLLVATAAMGVLALGTAGVGTVAWFATSNAATASTVAGDAKSISSVASDVTAAGYSITVTPAVIENLQLTNAVAEQGGSTYKLQYGAVTGGKAKVSDCPSASGYVAAISSWTAVWTNGNKPTQTEDINRFKNKLLTGGSFQVTGQAKLVDKNAVTGLAADATTGSFKIQVSNDNNLTLTVTQWSPAYVRVQASSADANNDDATPEAAHTDTIEVVASDLVIPN